MTRAFFIVTGGIEPKLFGDSQEAFEYMENTLIQYGKRYCFSDVQIYEAIDDMSKMYNRGNSDFFEGDLGECQVLCYREKLDFKRRN